MKWNDNIRTLKKKKFDKKNVEIYDLVKVLKLKLKVSESKLKEEECPTLREFSLMKQENIRMALLERKKYRLMDMRSSVELQCGFCTNYITRGCDGCPIIELVGRKCYYLNGYSKMCHAKTYNKFAEAHKAWCIMIGLWEEGWV